MSRPWQRKPKSALLQEVTEKISFFFVKLLNWPFKMFGKQSVLFKFEQLADFNRSRQRVQCVKWQPEFSLKLDTRHYTVVSWHTHQISQLHHLPLSSWEFRRTLVLSNLTSKICNKEWEGTLQSHLHCFWAAEHSLKGEVYWCCVSKWFQWFIIGGPWCRLKVPDCWT